MMADVNALIERMYAELGEEDAGGLLCSLESTIRTYEAERASLANEKERLRAELADRDKAVPDAEELCPTCVESLGVELARKCPANPPAHPPRQAVPEGLTFDALRRANAERVKASKYRECEKNWTPAHWMQATMGELGELANFLKKVDRGDFTLEDCRKDVENELADVQTYLDILAMKLGVDLGRATVAKFNEVSERIGSPVRLTAAPARTEGEIQAEALEKWARKLNDLAEQDAEGPQLVMSGLDVAATELRTEAARLREAEKP